MKKSIIAMLAVVAFAGNASATPDMMTFSTSGKKAPVVFNHKAHVEAVKNCASIKCHATKKGGKIEGFGKELAHKNCKGCHAEMKKGPATACKGCHK